MKRCALRILGRVARRGEVSLDDAIRMCHKRRGDHRNQYPLALIIEEHYLGMTINYDPPVGCERSREFALATTLHMYLVPADANGVVRYRGVETAEAHDPKEVWVFLTAKGALYLDELRQKRWDRIWSIVIGVTTGLLVGVGAGKVKSLLGVGSGWVKNHFGLH
jgi:hypothetical protein